MVTLADFWNSIEVKRKLFKVLLHERYTNTYRIFIDGNLIKTFEAENDSQAIKIFEGGE